MRNSTTPSTALALKCVATDTNGDGMADFTRRTYVYRSQPSWLHWRAGFENGIIPETIPTGTILADFSVELGGAVTEYNDPDAKFSISGTHLILDAPLSYAAKSYHMLAVSLSYANGSSFRTDILVAVQNPNAPAGTPDWLPEGVDDWFDFVDGHYFVDGATRTLPALLTGGALDADGLHRPSQVNIAATSLLLNRFDLTAGFTVVLDVTGDVAGTVYLFSVGTSDNRYFDVYATGGATGNIQGSYSWGNYDGYAGPVDMTDGGLHRFGITVHPDGSVDMALDGLTSTGHVAPTDYEVGPLDPAAFQLLGSATASTKLQRWAVYRSPKSISDLAAITAL